MHIDGMTEKQRIKGCIHFRSTDRVPWQLNYTTPLGDRLLKELGLSGNREKARDNGISKYVVLDTFLGNHIAYARNRGVNSVREVRQGIWEDEWGVQWDRTIDKDIGTPINTPLQSGRFTELTLPDPDDPKRYAHVQPILELNPNRYIISKFSYSLFERAWSLRGMENLLVDFFQNPSFVHGLMRSICDFNLRVMKNLRQYQIDGIYFGDDWGSQKAMLMSPDIWRCFIKPYLREMYAQAHAQDCDVFIHCCGQITPILDDLIEIGVNVFNPFQPEVMNIPEIMQRYSGRLAFYGSLSIQKTLPFGTKEDVKNEVQHRISLARTYGGLIISPSHDMPPDIPIDNILEMCETVQSQ